MYFDHAAATPVDEEAFAAAAKYIKTSFYNPSATYEASRSVRKELERARASVASVLGAKDQEIIFTAGGTEANNIAVHGVMRSHPGANIVVSAIEHESILEPAAQYERRIAPVGVDGVVDAQQLAALIDENTVLVSIMYANNEIGTVQPIKEIAALVRHKRSLRTDAYARPLYLHVDACQAANYLDLQVTRLGVDMMTLNGGKIYAMKQTGCLYVRTGMQVRDFVHGGGQEHGVRSGTENVFGILTFATMLQKIQSERKVEAARLEQISKDFFATLSQKDETIVLNGSRHKRLPNNINVLIPGCDGERLVMELDEAGVMVATGSACTASNDLPSHVLLAIGRSELEASASLRITFGRGTSAHDAQKAAEIICETLKKHRRLI